MALFEAEGLLLVAMADLDTAIASFDPEVFSEGAWGYWLRQSFEKALKSWLVHLSEIPPLAHDPTVSCACLLRRLEGHKLETVELQLFCQTCLSMRSKFAAKAGRSRLPNHTLASLLLLIDLSSPLQLLHHRRHILLVQLCSLLFPIGN